MLRKLSFKEKDIYFHACIFSGFIILMIEVYYNIIRSITWKYDLIDDMLSNLNVPFIDIVIVIYYIIFVLSSIGFVSGIIFIILFIIQKGKSKAKLVFNIMVLIIHGIIIFFSIAIQFIVVPQI